MTVHFLLNYAFYDFFKSNFHRPFIGIQIGNQIKNWTEFKIPIWSCWNLNVDNLIWKPALIAQA